ncbi:alcohol dehydrogenase catalytic domain-containing protein [Bradyrhizobium sp. STM 3562]|uniref:alcohol dehydrogenase catalytic domain-containing protein n=1 Tax=Bradyrhizobium sp. STM 3562 TaxID=578924 RepID=UPI00388D9B27
MIQIRANCRSFDIISNGDDRSPTSALLTRRILGQEGSGAVDEIGAAVSASKPGDHVLTSSISSCGKYDYCRHGTYSHGANGGWILGNRIDGTQAERHRSPHP